MEAALNGPMGKTVLEPTVLTIGSSPDNQLVVSNPNVSEHQAEIRPEGQGYSITDLGSSHGTFVNGQRLEWNTPHVLNAGDTITIGDTSFVYEVEGAPASLPHLPRAQAGSADSAVDEATLAGYPASTAFGAPSQVASGIYTPADTGGAYAPPQQPYTMYPGNVPGYPGAPVYVVPTTPPPAPQRRSRGRLWLWIALVVIAAVILGTFGFIYFTRSTPEKTLDAYCAGLQTQNYQAAYSQLAPSLQSTETEPQFVGIAQAPGKITNCTHSSANIIANSATATLTMMTSAGQTFNGPVALLQDNSNTWKISMVLSSPVLTLTTFCNALKAQDYDTAYSELSSALKSQHPEAQFASDFNGLACTYSGVSESGDSATASVRFGSVSGQTFDNTITLSHDRSSNNDWKIDGIQ